MATGIVAVAAHLLGMDLPARCLTVLNPAAYVVLWVLTVVRLAYFPREFVADLFDHNRGVGFFTIVAGTAVLGSQMLLFHHERLAIALWVCALLLWLAFTYFIFVGFTVGENKPSLADGINGGWLIAVVATQAVAELGTLLYSHFGPHREGVLFLCLSLWLCGGMLYIWMISLIFYRYTFFHFSPSDLMPPYWINMGAMAISTLAGTSLIQVAPEAEFLNALVPFLKGFTVFFWATATWWIPMLLLLGIWRHVIKKFKLAYDPLYWGAVFPLGMYTVCTLRLSQVMHITFVVWIPHYFIYVALAAWLLTFVGLINTLVRIRLGQGVRRLGYSS